jgi:hypothetical protein
MKKFIALLALVSTTAFANGYRHHGHNSSNIWVPLIIGGVIGYGMNQNQRQPEPIVIQQLPQPPVYINTPKVYNLGSPPPYQGATPLYQQRSQWEPSCNCYIVVYAQIGWQ